MIKRKDELDLAIKVSTKEKHEGEGLATLDEKEKGKKDFCIWVGYT